MENEQCLANQSILQIFQFFRYEEDKKIKTTNSDPLSYVDMKWDGKFVQFVRLYSVFIHKIVFELPTDGEGTYQRICI